MRLRRRNIWWDFEAGEWLTECYVCNEILATQYRHEVTRNKQAHDKICRGGY